jgi:hypothetical protein
MKKIRCNFAKIYKNWTAANWWKVLFPYHFEVKGLSHSCGKRETCISTDHAADNKTPNKKDVLDLLS